jgi:hypothetical protein
MTSQAIDHPLYMEQLATQRDNAIASGDVAEMRRLAQLYDGLGYAANADSLLRRVAHEEQIARMQ